LQTIVSCKLGPGAGAVVSVTEFISDGQRNVLAGLGLLKGDVRARSEQDRLSVETFMRQIANGIGQAHGVCVEVTFNTEFIETINAQLPTSAVVRTAEAIGLDAFGDREPMSFSEDFVHFNNVVPGCLLLMGNGQHGPNGQPLHANDYDFNDALLPFGVEFWSALVKDRLPA
jgi:metal-dependent amidase/aminoacylase/carboxypeptidase family protein